MKSKRHAKILELISQYDINTQEDLLLRLRDCGYQVTQATISRDIKELRLVKTLSENGEYKYVSSAASRLEEIGYKFHSIFVESVIDVDYAFHIVVIKCHVGMAQAACAALDSMELSGVVGSLAGDDTIFVLMRDEQQAIALMEELKKTIKK